MTGHDVLAKIEARLLDVSAQLVNAESCLLAVPDDEDMELRRDELQLAAEHLETAWQIVCDITIEGA
jgi:hypothetical protein